MNILPLIFAFLIIAALAAASFQYSLSNTQLNLSLLQGRLKAEADQRTIKARLAHSFQKAKNNGAKKEEAQDIEENAMSNVYFREQPPRFSSAKLNLATLYASGSVDPIVYEGAAALMRRLYSRHAFWQKVPNPEYQILDALMKTPQAPWNELFAVDDPMYMIVYHIIKGSNAYDLTTGKGIPPFTDFVCFVDNRKALCFPKTHKLLLEIFLPNSLCKEIAQMELKNDNHSLSETAFQHLKSQYAPLLPESLFHFSVQKNEEADLIVDNSTGVAIRNPHHRK